MRARLTRRNLALAAIVLVGLTYATMIQSFSWNQTSHYDLIRALDNGQTTIDPYQVNTGDKASYRGHVFSARAPGLALAALPVYDGLKAVGAEHWATTHQAGRNDDAIIWLIGLWGNVLPGLLLAALIWRVADRFEPGYGIAAAVAAGLGTMLLPLSTLLFSHVFTAFLGFAAFWLMLRERDGPPNLALLAVAGLAVGYAISSEYPLAFVAVGLGLYMLARADARTPVGLLGRSLAYVGGALVGIVPLLLYNHYAFGSWTHLAYSNVPRQHTGFFGISLPRPGVLITLLADSRGLLTLSPVLIMGAVGTVLLYRRGRRAEALTITGICACYVIYNSGYYLPFGGGFMAPRFLATMVPFLAAPLGIAFRRFPGPTVALAACSVTAMLIATATHPLIGYETETVVWHRLLGQGNFQPTIATAYGAGRGWGAIWPFALAAGLGLTLGGLASVRMRLHGRALLGGLLALITWGLLAALAPTALGVDHRGLLDIMGAGDRTALHKGWPAYPLTGLVLFAVGGGLVGLLVARLVRHRSTAARERPAPRPGSRIAALGVE